MAEVKIDITAEDKATPVLNAVAESTKGVARYVEQIGDSFKHTEASAAAGVIKVVDWVSRVNFLVESIRRAKEYSDKSINEDIAKTGEIFEKVIKDLPLESVMAGLDASFDKTLTIDTAQATHAIEDVKASVDSVSVEKALCLDTSSASQAVADLATAIEPLESAKTLTLDATAANQAVTELGRVIEPLEGAKTLTLDATAANQAVIELGRAADSVSTEKALSFDVSRALQAVERIKTALASLDTAKTLNLDSTQAVQAAAEVKAAIDAIPETTTKTVILQYQTQASPVMPFSEGMVHIKDMMDSLPTEGAYTVRFTPDFSGIAYRHIQRQLGRGEVGESFRSDRTPGREQKISNQNITFAPAIHINGAEGKNGKSLASEIDKALADKWRYNRSELKRAMAS